MTKKPTSSTIFICSSCSEQFSKWLGKCPSCGEFGTLSESESKQQLNAVQMVGLKSSGSLKPSKKASTFKELGATLVKRIPTGINEFDRVLGGGFVDSEVILFAAVPGSGKSTLSLSIADKFARLGKKVLYASGEESEQQIALRAKRMGIDNENIKVTSETNLETILGHVDEIAPDLLIVDSLQAIASLEVTGSKGSISQSNEAAHTLTTMSKSKGIITILISQVVKSGELAGSNQIQHVADATIILENDDNTPLRFLRSTKNRFGPTTEVGVFQHSEKGLEEVADPSGIFLETDGDDSSGASCSFVSEGVRQIPVEIQALVSRTTLPTPRKQFNGVNYQRGQIVCAILDKFCSARLYENDVFVSTVSGLKVIDPQADLSIAASILSSLRNLTISNEDIFLGELSLTGHVRGAFMVENKLKEAERMGFTRAVIPQSAYKNLSKEKRSIKIVPIRTIKELLDILSKSNSSLRG